MANVQGKYLLRFVVPETSYTFTNNARNAAFHPTAGDKMVDLRALNSSGTNTRVHFISAYKCTILRACIVPNGAPGLQAGNNTPYAAATVKFIVGQDDGLGGIDAFTLVNLTFPNWGEWIEINKTFNPFEANLDPLPQLCDLFIRGGSDSMFYCDDFNLQADFVGQDVTPIIELEIDTAGLYDTDTHNIF